MYSKVVHSLDALLSSYPGATPSVYMVAVYLGSCVFGVSVCSPMAYSYIMRESDNFTPPHRPMVPKMGRIFGGDMGFALRTNDIEERF